MFVQGTAGVAMQVVDGRLQTTDEHAAALQYAAYLLDGRIYPEGGRFGLAAEQRFHRRRVDHRIVTGDGELRFDGRPIQLPRGARVRILWQAIEWRGWILALVRTSETDAPAHMTPPFLATELITFSVNGSDASLRYVDFNPPLPTGLQILNPQP